MIHATDLQNIKLYFCKVELREGQLLIFELFYGMSDRAGTN